MGARFTDNGFVLELVSCRRQRLVKDVERLLCCDQQEADTQLFEVKNVGAFVH